MGRDVGLSESVEVVESFGEPGRRRPVGVLEACATLKVVVVVGSHVVDEIVSFLASCQQRFTQIRGRGRRVTTIDHVGRTLGIRTDACYLITFTELKW